MPPDPDDVAEYVGREFERGYAERSGVSVEELHFYGQFPMRCSCDWEECEGWAMGHQHEDALNENEARRLRTVVLD